LENKYYKLSQAICGVLVIILFVVGWYTEIDSVAATKYIFAGAFIIPLLWLAIGAILEYIGEHYNW